jgi:hypothetical protein
MFGPALRDWVFDVPFLHPLAIVWRGQRRATGQNGRTWSQFASTIQFLNWQTGKINGCSTC